MKKKFKIATVSLLLFLFVTGTVKEVDAAASGAAIVDLSLNMAPKIQIGYQFVQPDGTVYVDQTGTSYIGTQTYVQTVSKNNGTGVVTNYSPTFIPATSSGGMYYYAGIGTLWMNNVKPNDGTGSSNHVFHNKADFSREAVGLNYIKTLTTLPPSGETAQYNNLYTERVRTFHDSGKVKTAYIDYATVANQKIITRQDDGSYKIPESHESRASNMASFQGGTMSYSQYAHGIIYTTFIRYYMKPFQVKETYENESGTLITPPTGFTQGKLTDANADIYYHPMNPVPITYAVGGVTYEYQGWYQGKTKPATLKTSNPPTPKTDYTVLPRTNEELDADGEIHVVYVTKVNISEKFIDMAGTPIDSTALDTSNIQNKGTTFTGSPTTPTLTHAGKKYVYKGWKNGAAGALQTTAVSIPVVNTNTDVYYVYALAHTLTEKIVDTENPGTLVDVANNNKTSEIEDGHHHTATPTATISDTSGDDWDYVGWENVTDAPGTIHRTPVSLANVDGNKVLKYHYERSNTIAKLNLKPTPQYVATSGDTVTWQSRLENDGGTNMKNIVIKKTSNWSAGLSDPTHVVLTPADGSPAVTISIPAGAWSTGLTLTGIIIPHTTDAFLDLEFKTTASGSINEVLKAEIEATGNFSPVTASNIVRIDDPDEPNLNVTGTAGFINVPKFDFGIVPVELNAKNHKLDPTAYQAGNTRALYVRLKDLESQAAVNWTLTASLSQFTDGTSRTLPVSTALNFNNSQLSSVVNYNEPSEALSGTTSLGAFSIASNGAPVSLSSSSGIGVYQLDLAFNDVELFVPGHAGVAGVSYNSFLDWTLVTAP